ncbi:MAG: hypothetical protein A2168_05900 [Planctomycetes bacterium RBG_13_50_24]|nr:MAG: hypothetical protein A2168_05900 [Planctomycetes bacterium RBG_13_50_24]
MLLKLSFRLVVVYIVIMAIPVGGVIAEGGTERNQLDPHGKIHIPIGIANSLDTLKTFVEAEGNFSPGVGSFGVYFWIFDKTAGRLVAPTMDGVNCEHGLAGGRYLIPWAKWSAGDITVKTEICQVKRRYSEQEIFVVGARVTLNNTSGETRDIGVYAALRPIGPAGFDVKKLTVSSEFDILLVDDHAAIVAAEKPSKAGVLATDTTGELALVGRMADHDLATSQSGDCSGALYYNLRLSPGGNKTLDFVCPVLPGRRAVGHQWDGVSEWAQFDLAQLNPYTGGTLQPDPGLDYYREINVSSLFAEATEYWKRLTERINLDLPDARWEDAFAAIIAHAAMEMNQGAPDVAVVNYNVFNRDGVYVANIFQKSGNKDLAVEAIDYFTKHPFNGRSYPEADNPGQILWAMGQQWQFYQDKEWARRIYPSVRKIAEMIEYYRTTSGPYWVQMDSLNFGPALPEDNRRELKPGRCDGSHPEYTEAFDIAGLYSAANLADAVGESTEAAGWRNLAGRLLEKYDEKFGDNLANQYGSYSVLWPCRLYPLDNGRAHGQFRDIGGQEPGGWRYFALAKAHQGLLAGNRQAGYGTLQRHLEHEQMKGWYAFDEGGKSGPGGWDRLRTTWNGNIAMPHGWAIAELWLLMRDCLAFENDRGLVLLSGIPPAWFTYKDGIRIEGLPTYFGKLNLLWKPTQGGATLSLDGTVKPPNGFLLRLPESLEATVTVNGRTIPAMKAGEFLLQPHTREVHISFSK